ncbi:MAG: ATP-binding protein [Candidatus Cloacimonetes bacterium]|nr:ATP-binding protein [Candidatus Cloacimonadota bacterium]
MREIVVISGKGGTGKTTLTATLAYMLGASVTVADCDVDAADMHLLLQPQSTREERFYSGDEPEIDASLCTGCGCCEEVCRFDAIHVVNGVAVLNPFLCEGCGYCARVCPVEAIAMRPCYVGLLFESQLSTEATMIHARLTPGGENSGKLVARVKKDARAAAERDGCDIVLVDGSPGIGCPVISSLSGADYVALVTEPTQSALHDLGRVVELLERFHLRAGCVLNKSDIHPAVAMRVREFLADKDIPLLAEIPYDERVLEAIRLGKTPVEHAPQAFQPLFKNILDTLLNESKEDK